eukprot:11084127-Ditylum_brightwellii.AAC.1
MPAKHFYKPDGTMCLAHAVENKIIIIITAYQPCKSTKGTGTTTYHQQLSHQQANSTSKMSPHRSFINDLMTWMVQGYQKGE